MSEISNTKINYFSIFKKDKFSQEFYKKMNKYMILMEDIQCKLSVLNTNGNYYIQM